MIFVGYPCIGKSSIAGHDNFIDLEPSFFNNGQKDWYVHYCTIACNLSEQGYNVFISSHEEVIDYLEQMGIKFIIIYPSPKLYDEYIIRSAKRYSIFPTEKNKRAMLRIIEDFHFDVYNLSKKKNSISIPKDCKSLLSFINEKLKPIDQEPKNISDVYESLLENTEE